MYSLGREEKYLEGLGSSLLHLLASVYFEIFHLSPLGLQTKQYLTAQKNRGFYGARDENLARSKAGTGKQGLKNETEVPPLPAVNLRAGKWQPKHSWSWGMEPDSQSPPAGGHSTGIPNIHRILTALPRQALGSLEKPPGCHPHPSSSSRQQLPHQNLLSTGQGAAAQWLWDITAGAEGSRRKSRFAWVGNTFSLHLGLFQACPLSAGLLARPRPPVWEAEEVHGSREVSNQTFLAQRSRAAPAEPFQTSSSAKQVYSVNFADAEAGQSY